MTPHGYRVLLPVTLIATSNPRLADRLPLVGQLTIHETRTDDSLIPGQVTFRMLDSTAHDGLGAPVHVDQAVWLEPARVGDRVTTVAELDALPVGTILQSVLLVDEDRDMVAYRCTTPDWTVTGIDGSLRSSGLPWQASEWTIVRVGSGE